MFPTFSPHLEETMRWMEQKERDKGHFVMLFCGLLCSGTMQSAFHSFPPTNMKEKAVPDAIL